MLQKIAVLYKKAPLEAQIVVLTSMFLRLLNAELLHNFFCFSTQNFQSNMIVSYNYPVNNFSKLLLVETLQDKGFYQIRFNPRIIDNYKSQVVKIPFTENFFNKEL